MLGIINKKRKAGLTVEVVRKPCVFIINTSVALDALRRLSLLFEESKVIVEKMQMNRFRNGDAMIIVHCLAESENIGELEKELHELPGVDNVERVVS